MKHIRKYETLSKSYIEYLISPEARNSIANVGPIYVKCEKPLKDGLKPVYRQLDGGDYIIQPKFMLNSGSMCVTELYSKSLRKRLVHELLFKEKMESILPKLKEHRKKGKYELDMKKLKKRFIKKKVSRNAVLLRYEKNYLCSHNNTDGSGTLLRNLSKNKKLLKTNIYLRGKEYLKIIEDRNSVINGKQVKNNVKNVLLKRLKSSSALNVSCNKKYKPLIERYEKNIMIMQNSLKYYFKLIIGI